MYTYMYIHICIHVYINIYVYIFTCIHTYREKELASLRNSKDKDAHDMEGVVKVTGVQVCVCCCLCCRCAAMYVEI